MDAATLKVAKNYTNEQAAQKATNSPVEEISFDGGIYSVGNNVVNGQVSVVVKGRTWQQLFPIWEDKDTNNIPDNYMLGGSASITKSMINGIFNVTLTSDGSFILYKDIKLINGHKYYISGDVLSSNKDINVYVHNDIGTYRLAGKCNIIGCIITAESNVTRITIGNNISSPTPAYSTGDMFSLKNMYLYDLTETFGAGSEPTTAEQASRIFHYVSGTKSTNSVRIRSPKKNIIPYPYTETTKTMNGVTFTDNKDGSITVNGTATAQATFTLFGASPEYGLPTDIGLQVGKKYTLSGSPPPLVILQLQAIGIASYGSYGSYTVEVAESWKKIRIWLVVSQGSVVNNVTIYPQLEYGLVSTAYEPYKESSVTINLSEPLRSLPNGTKDEVNVTDGVATKRLGQKIIQESDITISTSSTNVDLARITKPADSAFYNNYLSGLSTLGTYPEYTTGTYDSVDNIGKFSTKGASAYIDIFFPKGTTLEQMQTELAGTSLTYQLATPIVTKLPAQAPLQVFENGTVYVDPMGDSAESTLPTTELAIPIGTSNKFGVASHDYDGTAADWALTNNESKCFLLAVSNAGGAANIIAPDAPGVMYAISNASGYTITIKISGGTGVAITNGKKVLVIHDGTDYTALTAEL